jgi:hypothetical protein
VPAHRPARRLRREESSIGFPPVVAARIAASFVLLPTLQPDSPGGLETQAITANSLSDRPITPRWSRPLDIAPEAIADLTASHRSFISYSRTLTTAGFVQNSVD